MLRYIDYRLWQRNRKAVICAAIALTTTFFYVGYAAGRGSVNEAPSPSLDVVSPREEAGNSTLGFEIILAISAQSSWRTRGLQAAAKLANLTVLLPPQPYIADEMLQAFEELGSGDPNIKRPSHGSAKAWLAHLDMVKFVVTSGFETALIIEDDVDWDVTIRDQMRLVSDNVRAFATTSDGDSAPYGSAWDVLWLGHCGEVTKPETLKREYPDPSLMPTELYAGWSKKWLENIFEGHRAVQWTEQVVCTFGYGVSRAGAQNMLKFLGQGQDEAFDVALMTACQKKHLQCITINPELMHHYNPHDGTGYVSPNNEANSGRQSSGEDAFERLKGTTANMKNSARCAALFNETCPQPPTRAEDY